MFSMQGVAPEFPRSNLKRVHEDDSADIGNGGTVGFTEHRNKRIHALPLRTSPTARRWAPAMNFCQPGELQHMPTQPHNITPADSDSEEVTNQIVMQQQSAYTQSWGRQVLASQPEVPVLVEAVDMDMDMTMDCIAPSPQRPLPGSPNHLIPGPFQPDPIASSITGRMPTPIQPSFAAQVRGTTNWSGAAGNIMQSGGIQMSSTTCPTAYGVNGNEVGHGMDGGYHDQSVPRSLDQAAMNGWNTLHTRSLPSPISESGGEEMGSPDMVLDTQVRSNSVDNAHLLSTRTHSALSLPAFHSHGSAIDGHPGYPGDFTRASSSRDSGIDVDEFPMASGTGMMDSTVVTDLTATSMDTDAPATPSPRKGHTRSRHTVNSWTLQPGMKKSFSIGYRADCEKCRNKVPGHFNHIIVS